MGRADWGCFSLHFASQDSGQLLGLLLEVDSGGALSGPGLEGPDAVQLTADGPA